MQNKFKWPGGAKCAVSLTYDDGLDSQIENALPALKQCGIKGTFFLSGAALLDPAKHPGWKEAVRQGHEIGCHTLYHACDAKWEFVKKGYALQDYSDKRMRDELNENKRILNSFGYKPKDYVFAYPCGEKALGPEMGRSYKPLVAEMFMAARGVKEEYAMPGNIDLMEIPSFEANTDAAGLVRMVEGAKECGGWAVILFHGIGGDYISVKTEAHEGLVKYLAENKKTIYTDTFGKIAALAGISA